MRRPVLSVVIANYNYGRFLEDAIQSVVGQNENGVVELIVCDAASTDDSVEIIKRYADRISWWCSEKDGGQSAAFNKGFSHAKGRFFTWLNADDWFAPNALRTVLRHIEQYPDCEWFAGGECRVDARGKILRFDRNRSFQRIRAECGELQPNGPSSFFSRALYERAGGYVDESFHYAMDIELWERFYFQAHARFRKVPGYIWMFRAHEASKTAAEEAGVVRPHDESNVAWFRRQAECRLIKEKYAKHTLTLWRRFLSLSPFENIMSRFDTMRYCGEDWRTFFPEKNARLGVI